MLSGVDAVPVRKRKQSQELNARTIVVFPKRPSFLGARLFLTREKCGNVHPAVPFAKFGNKETMRTLSVRKTPYGLQDSEYVCGRRDASSADQVRAQQTRMRHCAVPLLKVCTYRVSIVTSQRWRQM